MYSEECCACENQELADPPYEGYSNGTQTNCQKEWDKEQPMSTKQLKFIVTISADKVDDDIICKET